MVKPNVKDGQMLQNPTWRSFSFEHSDGAETSAASCILVICAAPVIMVHGYMHISHVWHYSVNWNLFGLV